MTLPPLVGVDTGSRHAGCVTLRRTPDGPFPFALIDHDRPDVDPADLEPAVDAIWRQIEAVRLDGCRVIIEGGNPYGPGGMIRAGAAVALQHAARLGDRVAVRCATAGVPVRQVVAATWRARVVPRELRGEGVDKIGRRRTFSRDPHVTAALALYLSPEHLARLVSPDRRDAAGAVIGVVLAEEDAAAKTVPRARTATAAVPRVRAGRGRRPGRVPKPLTETQRKAKSAAQMVRDRASKGPPALCRGGCGRPARGPGSVAHIRGLPCPTADKSTTPVDYTRPAIDTL